MSQACATMAHQEGRKSDMIGAVMTNATERQPLTLLGFPNLALSCEYPIYPDGIESRWPDECRKPVFHERSINGRHYYVCDEHSDVGEPMPC